MNSKHVISKKRCVGIAVAIHLAALGFSAYGWSISGTVKNTSGDALAGVDITVKESATPSTTTDENGNFLLEHETSVKPLMNSVKASSFSAQLVRGELQIRSPHDGAMELSLVNCAGQTLWASKAVSKQGVARVAFPKKLGSGITFLQIKNSKGVEYHSMGWGPDGLYIKNTQLTARSSSSADINEETYPTILFKKADYHDTSLVMTSEKMTDVNMVMTKNEKICPLPTQLRWVDSGMVVGIKPDNNHKIVSVKDPTIQKYNGKYLIYCTVYNTTANTWSMQFIQFEKFSEANNQTPFFMDQVNGFGGYKCAPELFYFAPQDLWYLIWQQQDPAYSTTKTPDNPRSWSAPKQFYQNGRIPNAPNL
ncbi:MAG: non-reducing end alpha-L-arabinofuranosidase family hydrolase, partial [Fibrobacter sp.]|nr:non-reducing end alpha-L-arabinofuranosidase family hydrolase [Fibrobacter sp.]